MSPDFLVARGDRMQPLPPSKAPVLVAVGWASLIVAATLTVVSPTASSIARGIGLALLTAGMVAATLRLTNAGRALVAVPVALLAAAVVAGALHAKTASLRLGVIAFIGSAIATLLLFERRGVYVSWHSGGRLDPRYARTHRADGIAECRVVRNTLEIETSRGPPESYSLAEVSRARLVEATGYTDLVVTDGVEDVIVRLRATTEAERSAVRRMAERLDPRALATR